jgi:hypothetical protein
MVHDNDTVARRVDVQLDRIRAALEGALEGGQGIFRQLALGAAMRDALHWSRSVHV